jgi:hypothetical protein
MPASRQQVNVVGAVCRQKGARTGLAFVVGTSKCYRIQLHLPTTQGDSGFHRQTQAAGLGRVTQNLSGRRSARRDHEAASITEAVGRQSYQVISKPP